MDNPLVPILVLLACLFLGGWGWGSALVLVGERLGWERCRDVVSPALQVALGVALFCCAGGYLVSAGVARFDVLAAWQLVGVVLLVAIAVLRHVELRRFWTGWTTVRVLVCALAAAFVVDVAIGSAIGQSFYNPDDDDAAYIYLAERLLRTGGLIDPFNQRRLVDYGGGTLLQAMFLHVGNNSTPRDAEYLFAALLVGLLAVGALRRRFALAAVIVLGAGVIVGADMGQIVNEAPTYSGAALTLASFQLTGRLSGPPTRRDGIGFGFVGLLAAGVMSLRIFLVLAPVMMLVLVIALCRRSRRGLGSLLAAGGGLVAGVAGWAVANALSSGTPLFPFLLGNYDPAFPSSSEPGLSLATHLRQLLDVLRTQGIWLIIGGTLLVAVVLAIRQERTRAAPLAAAGIATLVELTLFSADLSGSPQVDVIRFVSPTTLACALLAIDALWPLAPPGTRWTPLLRLPAAADARRSIARALPAAAAITAICAATFGTSVPSLVSRLNDDASLARVVIREHVGIVDRYRRLRPFYDALNGAIAPRTHVLAAVDDPSMLDMAKYDVATLDIVGSVSPPPHLPVRGSATAVVSYLRRLGITEVVVDDPTERGLYDAAWWRADLDGPTYEYRGWARNFLWWDRIAEQLRSRYPTRVFGRLALVDIVPEGTRPRSAARPG